MDGKLKMIIESLGVYLPPDSVGTGEILEKCAHPIKFPLERMSGIASRRMAGETEFSFDLARKAVSDCLQKSQYDPGEIDMLICCNISRYDGPEQVTFEPGTSMRLRHYFGFDNAQVFDLTNACAGMFTGFFLLEPLVLAGTIRRAMVVSGEYITHLTKTAQKEIRTFMDPRMACLTLGDAAAAVILHKGGAENTGFEMIEIQTLGDYSPFCIAKETDKEHGGMIMLTDSVNMTNVGIHACARHSIDSLNRCGLPPDSFNHLVMHQTSTMTMNGAIREINKVLGVDVCNDGNTVNNLNKRGNTASTSHMVAVNDFIRNGTINTGDRILFSINASGLTIGTASYVMDELPEKIRGGKAGCKEDALIPEKALSRRCVRIESKSVRDEEQDSFERLVRVAEECLDGSSYKAHQIQILIYCGVYRSEYLLEPAYAALLAGRLKMNSLHYEKDGSKTLAFDIFNGAVGFMNALSLAKDLILTNKVKTVMIVASETENNRSHFPGELLGIRETASALILEEGDSGFSDVGFGYEFHPSAYQSNWTVRSSKSYLDIRKDACLEDVYIHVIADTVRTYLQEHGLSFKDLDYLVPPQISSYFIQKLIKALDWPTDKTIDVVGDSNDLFTSSFTYSLDYLDNNGRKAQKGERGLFVMVGSGIQCSCMLYTF